MLHKPISTNPMIAGLLASGNTRSSPAVNSLDNQDTSTAAELRLYFVNLALTFLSLAACLNKKINIELILNCLITN